MTHQQAGLELATRNLPDRCFKARERRSIMPIATVHVNNKPL
jgi:hypothetical protein